MAAYPCGERLPGLLTHFTIRGLDQVQEEPPYRDRNLVARPVASWSEGDIDGADLLVQVSMGIQCIA